MEVWILGLWAMAWIITQVWTPPDGARQFVLVLILVLIFVAMFFPFIVPAFRPGLR